MNFSKFGMIMLLAIVMASCGGIESDQSEQSELQYADDNGGITLAEGFKSVVVADSVGSARHITVAENGDIYIALDDAQEGKGIAALRDTNGDGVADTTAYFGSQTGTGIQLHNSYLYFGSDTSVVRYEMNNDNGELGTQSEPETIIGGFPDQSQHAVKPFTFDGAGNIYVNVGAPSNACQEETRTPGSPGMDPCPLLEEHAGIWRFRADSSGQMFPDDGSRYATGIRNAVALDWDPNTNQLYVVQHGRDQLSALWPDYYDAEENAELPAEEMFAISEGDNFGWPYVYFNWQTEQKMVAPEYGGDGELTAEKGKYENPIIAFPGHWGPNDLLFYNGSSAFPEKYSNSAFVAFHGSWNRAPEPQAGYKIVLVPFSNDSVSGDFEVFADGFAGTDTLKSPGNARYRPMGLAQGPDGSLYIVESMKGKVWRITHPDSEEQQSGS